MEQKFSNNSLDLQILQEFCEHEGESVLYRKAITSKTPTVGSIISAAR